MTVGVYAPNAVRRRVLVMTDRRPEWAERLESGRTRRHWGKHEMARRLLTQVGIAATPDKVKSLANQIRGYEGGDHYPRNWDHVYAEVLDVPHEELFPTPVGTLNQSPSSSQEDDDVKRRAALQIISAVAAGTAVPPGAMETLFSGLDHALGSPLGVADWEATVHEYGQLIIRQPAGALVGDLTADILAVNELLNNTQSSSDHVALLRVSAGLSGVLAIDLGDVGDRRAARVAWNAARRTADASGDRDLRVWVRGRAAQDSFWVDRPEAVVAGMASEAIEIADGAPSPGLARAYAARVYVAADRNDKRQVETALGDLQRVVDQLPQGTVDQSVLTYQQSQVHWAESYARAWNGDRRAEASLEQAFALYPPHASAPRENLSLMRAAVLINDREVETGLEQAITTLENSQRRCTGRLRLAKRVLQTVPEKAHTLPAARELRALTTAT